MVTVIGCGKHANGKGASRSFHNNDTKDRKSLAVVVVAATTINFDPLQLRGCPSNHNLMSKNGGRVQFINCSPCFSCLFEQSA